VALEHVSFSALSLFDGCPATYHAQRIRKVSQLPSKPLVSGILVHAVVELYLKELYESGLDRFPGGVGDIVEKVFSENERVNSTEYYTDVLRSSMAFAKNFTLDPDNVLDMEMRFEMPLGDGLPKLLTFTDLREQHHDQDGPFIGITDFKSGWGSSQSEANNFQLDIEGAQTIHELGPDTRVMVRNYFTRWNFATKWRKISEWDVNNALARCRAIFHRMEHAYQTRSYPENPGEGCLYCPIAQECKVLKNLGDVKALIVNAEMGMDRIRQYAVLEAALTQMKKLFKTWANVNGELRLEDGYGFGSVLPSPSMTLVGVREAHDALGDDFYNIINIDRKKLKKMADDGRLTGLWVEEQGRPRLQIGKVKDDDEADDE
jgi:PD-(D/E)XK nuclease superfamily